MQVFLLLIYAKLLHKAKIAKATARKLPPKVTPDRDAAPVNCDNGGVVAFPAAALLGTTVKLDGAAYVAVAAVAVAATVAGAGVPGIKPAAVPLIVVKITCGTVAAVE